MLFNSGNEGSNEFDDVTSTIYSSYLPPGAVRAQRLAVPPQVEIESKVRKRFITI